MRDFSKTSLILLGHGSTQNPHSSVPVRAHAEELRRRQVFGEVRVGFLKESPSVVEAVLQARFADVVVVPVFISEGYFSEQVIPQQLGLAGSEGEVSCRRRLMEDREVRYCRVVGTHPCMTRVLLARAGEVIHAHPLPDGRVPAPAETTLFIAGHGTDRSTTSRRAIEQQADWVAAESGYHSVQAVFMEEAPEIARCPELCPTEYAVVVPFFISDGLHSQEDIPVLLGESPEAVRERILAGRPTFPNPTRRRERWIWYARAVGTEPLMAEVIMERAIEAANWP